QIKLVDATPIILPTTEANGFRVSREDLEQALSPRTKALLLNTPSNPTGVVLDKNDLQAIAALAVERNLYVISDEAYETLTYDGVRHLSIASLGEAIKARTILVNTLSKAYAMTGWRIGYAAGPKELIRAIIDLQSQTANPTSFAQKGAIEALIGPQAPVVAMREEFARRRKSILERLDKIPDLRYVKPFGAFYVFLNISAYFGRRFQNRVILNSTDMAAYLLDEAKVALVPGKDFGSDAHIRLSYALSIEQLAKGLDRIEEALMKLR
ncbi:MAG: aminotransferase class I/II-fold pyridoxal phosphate-dependent enzyme, partial [candidate division NC10 bacterium]|nr:aminotransferase class I/II-fold pyridoxal phosphate-dependent enzyme [candidate division NC10 bacterium]